MKRRLNFRSLSVYLDRATRDLAGFYEINIKY